MSTGALANIIPVKPPRVNKHKKANENKNAGEKKKLPSHNVANQLKILIPVGTAIIIVVVVKKIRESISIPTVYI